MRDKSRMIDFINETLIIISRLQKESAADQRALALAKTNIEQGYMWFERAIEIPIGDYEADKEQAVAS